MQCKNCGKEIEDNSSFCLFCGGKLFDEDSGKISLNTKPQNKNLKWFGLVGFIVSLVSLFGFSIMINVRPVMGIKVALFFPFVFAGISVIGAICCVADFLIGKLKKLNPFAFVGGVFTICETAFYIYAYVSSIIF